MDEAGLRRLVRGLLREGTHDEHEGDQDYRVVTTALHPSHAVALERFLRDRIEDFFALGMNDDGMGGLESEEENSLDFEIRVGSGNLLEVELMSWSVEGSDYLEGQIENYEVDEVPGPLKDDTKERAKAILQKHYTHPMPKPGWGGASLPPGGKRFD